MSRNHRIVTGIGSIFLILVLLIGSVNATVLQPAFYKEVQREQQVSQRMGISEQDVENATIVALAYTKGLTDDLSYVVSKNNTSFDLYSSQDKEHMIDVHNLYVGAYNFMLFSSVLVFVCMIILIIKRKVVNIYSITKIFNQTSLYSFVFVIIITLFAFVNFNVFWTFFHKVFFRNDLWLMNPAVDALVNLFPEALFSALVFKIIFRFGALFIGSNVMAIVYRKMSERRLAK